MHPGLLVLSGFILGTAGVKAAQSRLVHKACVQVTACGMQCKEYVEHVVDETKAQCDDIKAEAEALKDLRDAEKHSDEVVIESTAVTENESTETVVKETVVVKND